MDSASTKKNSGGTSTFSMPIADKSGATSTVQGAALKSDTASSGSTTTTQNPSRPKARLVGIGRLPQARQIRNPETQLTATRHPNPSIAATDAIERKTRPLPADMPVRSSDIAGAGSQALFTGLDTRITSGTDTPSFTGLDARPASEDNSSFLGVGVRTGEPLPSMLSPNENGELEIRTAFESMPSNKHSYEYFCTADPIISDEYKQKLEEAIKSKDFKALDELDTEMRETYKSQEQQTRFAGFRIVRRDGLNRKTNLPGAAKHIEIETRGLSSKNLIRLPLKNGEYLELGLDENGNFSGKAIPLTKDGSNLKRAISLQENDPNIVYNRYDTVLSDLQAMADIKMNGVDILPDIIKAIQNQKEQSLSHKQDNAQISNGGNSSTASVKSPLSSVVSGDNETPPANKELGKIGIGIRAGLPGQPRGI